MRWKTMLCPTDYTGLSESAFRVAVELAHDHQARLIVLHAVETLGPENVSYGEAVANPQPAAYRKRLWEELHRQVHVSDAAIEPVYVLSEEDPASAIVDAAAHYQCDLIVMGSHGRQGLRRWLEGSVTDHVIRRAPCPVLVVKESEPTQEKNGNHGTALHPHFLSEPEEAAPVR